MQRALERAHPPFGKVFPAPWRFLPQPVLSILRFCLRDLTLLVAPSDCRLCGDPLLEASALPVCADCIADVEPVSSMDAAACTRCGEHPGLESVRFAAQHNASAAPLCAGCRLVPPAFVRATAHSLYGGPTRELIHLLKYARLPAAADVLGVRLAEAILRLGLPSAAEVPVVAVPLFPAKERQRGYNQSVLLADAAIATLRGFEPNLVLRSVHSALSRLRDTESQFSLRPRERRANLHGAFAVTRPELIAGGKVLLIDDIYTTGATARECSRVLLEAGASAVYVATLSRAQSESPQAVARWDAAAFRQPTLVFP